MSQVVEEIYEKIKTYFSPFYHDQIKELMEKYGEGLCAEVGSTLLYAGDERISDAIEKLNKHYEKNIHFQHPHIRGVHSSNKIFFENLCGEYMATQKA